MKKIILLSILSSFLLAEQTSYNCNVKRLVKSKKDPGYETKVFLRIDSEKNDIFYSSRGMSFHSPYTEKEQKISFKKTQQMTKYGNEEINFEFNKKTNKIVEKREFKLDDKEAKVLEKNNVEFKGSCKKR